MINAIYTATTYTAQGTPALRMDAAIAKKIGLFTAILSCILMAVMF